MLFRALTTTGRSLLARSSPLAVERSSYTMMRSFATTPPEEEQKHLETDHLEYLQDIMERTVKLSQIVDDLQGVHHEAHTKRLGGTTSVSSISPLMIFNWNDEGSHSFPSLNFNSNTMS